MSIFVLVHGAWHGSWCWDKIVSNLNKFNYRSLALDLPSYYNETKGFQGINLKTYVDYVIDSIKNLQEPVFLVGHSMAGVIITQVANNRPDLVKGIIYVCAFIPENNNSLYSEEIKTKKPTVALNVIIKPEKNSIELKKTKKIEDIFYNQSSIGDVIYARKRLQNQPLKPFLDKVELLFDKFNHIPKLYIECLQDNAVSIEDQRRMSKNINCLVESLDSDHSPFLSNDLQLTEKIINFANKI
jgi:pimeloyl-ACP methyl ester carboxylesterase